MLYNDAEIEIMSGATQPNMRKANIAVKPFENIIEDYLAAKFSDPAAVLDIGPGQCDFLDLAKKAGATETVGIDFDPAIQKLGALRGHEIFVADLRRDWPVGEKAFDGIFCRGSLNCHWFPTEDRLSAFLESISSCLKPGGWMWIAPWNKPVPGREDYSETVDRVVTSWASSLGLSVESVPEERRSRYGVGYQIPCVEVWHRL